LILLCMSRLSDVIERMRGNPTGVRFTDLCKVCDHYFGNPSQASGSHRVYRMPWSGDPRVNIQNRKGYAKAYQVRQVLKAMERLKIEDGTKEG
jgi:hypothetical protein